MGIGFFLFGGCDICYLMILFIFGRGIMCSLRVWGLCIHFRSIQINHWYSLGLHIPLLKGVINFSPTPHFLSYAILLFRNFRQGRTSCNFFFDIYIILSCKKVYCWKWIWFGLVYVDCVDREFIRKSYIFHQRRRYPRYFCWDRLGVISGGKIISRWGTTYLLGPQTPQHTMP